ncbi:S8 family serine peptidase [Rhodopseudomonas sp. BAL398]|uniref:S8 family serine peptidase n=1 Tax=Rhodopseudomonas sp. BAL398 TaxID=3034676 RepID=UPI0023E0F48F|nr:S8 family serine peptidase [Rhodopseudomonas sp. BAL398]MDF3812937.1 S8 family serine peptidase [Rhodopseudomonas sp. BAL398]WOK20743.1 S8 family serine peptidase [Rhodopseudomonas sp. BAL398]
MLDGPVDRTHDCFRGARLTPLETTAAAGAADGRATAQGTHIASLIFGQPCSSAEGLAPLCRGLVIPIFRDDRRGCSDRELAHAITLAVKHGAHIIHVSGGLLQQGLRPAAALAEAVALCDRHNVLIVAAGDGCTDLRGAFGDTRTILPIGAIDKSGRLLADAGRRALIDQGIMVPGSNLMGAELEGGIAYRTGSNYSAALVSGIAGLLLSAQIQDGQAPNPSAVGATILATATPRVPSQSYECQRVLIGRDNIQAAVERVVAEGGNSVPARCRFGVWRGSAAGSLAGHAAWRPRA